jgi:LBP / BPI / CETP family, C-terminal domain
MIPAIDVDSFMFMIDKDLVDITISGSIVADIANLFVQLFQDLVLGIIVNNVNAVTPAILTSDVNTFLYNIHGKVVLESLGNLGFDFSYTSPPVISDTQIDIYLNATVFNASFGEISPNEGFGDLLIDTTTRENIQIDVSRYMVESVFLTLFESDRLKLMITNELIPATSAFSLTTSSLNVFLPGLVEKYGEDV